MTTISTRPHEARPAVIGAIIDAATAWVDEQRFLSQARCVEILLDLYRASGDEFVQWCIAERLSDIRFVTVIDGDEMRSDLDAIAALTLPSSPQGATGGPGVAARPAGSARRDQ